MKEKLKSFIVTFLFPKECILCGKLLEFNSDRNICGWCEDNLSLTDFKPVLPVGEIHTRLVSRHFHVLSSPFNYESSARNGIIGLKFNGRRECAGFFAKSMADLIKNNEIYKNFDYIIPVPVSKRKKQTRGYNQCELIGEKMAEILGKPLMVGNLVRVKETKTQSLLSDKRQRIDNVKGVFELRDKETVKGKTILLVDDVYTTGATINECAKVLKGASAKKVLCVTAAVRLPKKRTVRLK